MRKKILVIGSSGFIGTNLIEKLTQNEEDWDVYGIDITLRKQFDNFKFYSWDLNNSVSDKIITGLRGIDYVVNLASETNQKAFISNPKNGIQQNINIMLNVLDLVRRINPKKFIHLSTQEVFGSTPENYSNKEYDTHLPSNPYIASKSSQEQICFSYWRSYNIPLIILSCSSVFGEYQNKQKFIPSTIKKIFNYEEVDIRASGVFKTIASRKYLYVKDLIDTIVYIIDKITPNEYKDSRTTIVVPTRINVSGDTMIDNLEIAKLISKHTNKPLYYKLVDFNQEGNYFNIINSSENSFVNLKKESFEDALVKTIKWNLSGR